MDRNPPPPPTLFTAGLITPNEARVMSGLPPYPMPSAARAQEHALGVPCPGCGAKDEGLASCSYCRTLLRKKAIGLTRLVTTHSFPNNPRQGDNYDDGKTIWAWDGIAWIQSPNLRLCINCKYGSDWNFECRHRVLVVSKINGKKSYGQTLWERGKYGRCGPEGKFWEAREFPWADQILGCVVLIAIMILIVRVIYGLLSLA